MWGTVGVDSPLFLICYMWGTQWVWTALSFLFVICGGHSGCGQPSLSYLLYVGGHSGCGQPSLSYLLYVVDTVFVDTAPVFLICYI